MHFEILVEDLSGMEALKILVPEIVSDEDSYNIHPYKGIGHLPKGLKAGTDHKKRLLLDQLPRLIRGYGKTFAGYPPDCPAALVIVCDLDDRCLSVFRKELLQLAKSCSPMPPVHYCFAVEEGEAWYLGDPPAIRKAYPKAKESILRSYENDSICGTWELLADAVFKGGCKALKKGGWRAVGREKSEWARKIAPKMDVDENHSPSFCYFREKLRTISDISSGGEG